MQHENRTQLIDRIFPSNFQSSCYTKLYLYKIRQRQWELHLKDKNICSSSSNKKQIYGRKEDTVESLWIKISKGERQILRKIGYIRFTSAVFDSILVYAIMMMS